MQFKTRMILYLEEKKRKEKGRKSFENRKICRLAHNFSFISVHYITYNCAFNIKLKLLPTYDGGTGNQVGRRPIRWDGIY